MKLRISIIICILTAAQLCTAGTTVFAQPDIEDHRSCVYCGMDRKAYGFSRVLVLYEDGGAAGICSLHCAVVELDANQRRKVKSLLVADRVTRTLIDAEKAFWVMGGKKSGVMTQRPKWAFESKAAAEAFIEEYGGKIVSWTEAFAAAREEASRESR
jgi:nitrous oxide reductase accessory protein NosL